MWDHRLGNHCYGSAICFKTGPATSAHNRTQGLHLDPRALVYFFPLPIGTFKDVFLLSEEWYANTNAAGNSE